MCVLFLLSFLCVESHSKITSKPSLLLRSYTGPNSTNDLPMDYNSQRMWLLVPRRMLLGRELSLSWAISALHIHMGEHQSRSTWCGHKKGLKILTPTYMMWKVRFPTLCVSSRYYLGGSSATASYLLPTLHSKFLPLITYILHLDRVGRELTY